MQNGEYWVLWNCRLLCVWIHYEELSLEDPEVKARAQRIIQRLAQSNVGISVRQLRISWYVVVGHGVGLG